MIINAKMNIFNIKSFKISFTFRIHSFPEIPIKKVKNWYLLYTASPTLLKKIILEIIDK